MSENLFSRSDYNKNEKAGRSDCQKRIVVFVLFVFLINRISKQTSLLRQEVNLLRGLLPICSHCKKIRDESNQWQPIESYITKHSGALFTHGICPECIEKYYPEYFKKKTNN